MALSEAQAAEKCPKKGKGELKFREGKQLYKVAAS